MIIRLRSRLIVTMEVQPEQPYTAEAIIAKASHLAA